MYASQSIALHMHNITHLNKYEKSIFIQRNYIYNTTKCEVQAKLVIAKAVYDPTTIPLTAANDINALLISIS